MSKVIRDCIGFALLCVVIGLENSCHPLSQSDARLKKNRDLVTRVFPRSRPVTRVYFEFSLALIVSLVLIGRCDYFGFGFLTFNRKAL